jgi:hypothetical protein
LFVVTVEGGHWSVYAVENDLHPVVGWQPDIVLM